MVKTGLTRNRTLKYLRGLNLKTKRVIDNLKPTKGEDCAPLSAASSAHISGPAGLKTTESH